jgi:hypothetical protein
VAGTQDLKRLLIAIANQEHKVAANLLDAVPSLATAGLVRRDEFFLAERFAQIYEGDTALHAAGFSYDRETARDLVARGADIRARDRRGAEPLHAAAIGIPGSTTWDPARQRDVVLYLIEAGAAPNAVAAGGVTPLHRAVRNRSSAAVEALLRAGADPRLQNEHGSTASDLARGRLGTVGRVRQWRRPNNELLSNCSRPTRRDTGRDICGYCPVLASLTGEPNRMMLPSGSIRTPSCCPHSVSSGNLTSPPAELQV